ncbi:MAG: hypothetical protein ACYSR5_13305, partial [Planctomycetota bacterium]
KHGLFARCDVISSESQDEFDCHRNRILAELAPAGPLESIFAERIVSLSWRLKRAERMQNQALDAELEDFTNDSWSRRFRRDPDDPRPDLTLGRVAAKDFTNYRVFDRLQLYERRIERSLYKAMREFQRLTLTPKPKRPEDPRTERQTPELKKQTQFDSPSSLPEQQPTPSDDSGPHPESAVTADKPHPQILKKQSQFADCPSECKPKSNKELPQAATAPTPAETNPVKPNSNRAT